MKSIADGHQSEAVGDELLGPSNVPFRVSKPHGGGLRGCEVDHAGLLIDADDVRNVRGERERDLPGATPDVEQVS